jgi:hypothetical protein
MARERPGSTVEGLPDFLFKAGFKPRRALLIEAEVVRVGRGLKLASQFLPDSQIHLNGCA